MKNQFSLEINKLCSENFNQFTPTTSGRFCGSCKTDVVDFTGKTSEEVINFFKENKSKNTCGRFSKNQLTTYAENQHKSQNFSFWKGIGLACLSLFTFNSLQAQEVKPKIESADASKEIMQQQVEYIVKGIVSDESGPLPGANILLDGTTIGIETDFDGKFKFPKKLKKGDVLLISYVGFDSQKIIISSVNSASNIELKINMKNDNFVLMGKVAVKQVYKSKKK